MNVKKRWALMLSASLMVSGMGQAQDVLMRRPLPKKTTSGSEQPSTNPSNPSTPTPTPTPDQTPSPSLPGASIDPGQYVNPGTPYTPEYGSPIFWWQPGEWSGGVCGTQTTMTRSVTCMGGTFYGYPDPNDGGGQSFQAVPVASNGGNPFDMGLEDVTPVDAAYCQNLEKVVTTYQGTQAGCDYQVEKASGSGQWKIDSDAPGSAQCSAYAYREPALKCTLDGAAVDMGFCTQQLGSSPIPIADFTEHGNFEGCSYEAEMFGESPLCKGDDYVETVTDAICYRSDGEVLFGADAAACPELVDLKFPFERTIGTCSRRIDFSGTGGPVYKSCTGDSQSVLFTKESVPYPTYDEASELAAQLCSNDGAECCQIIEQRDSHRTTGTTIVSFKGNTSIVVQNGSYDYNLYGTQYRAAQPELRPD